MSDTASSRLAVLAGLALWVPVAVGLGLAWMGESSLLGALLLLFEPVAVVGAAYAVLWQLASRRWFLGTALALGLAGGFAALHLPARPSPPADLRPEWTRELRACSDFAEEIRGPVRLVQWSLADGTELSPEATAMLGAQADLIVLHGTPTGQAGALLAQVTGGDARFYPPSDTGEGGMTIVVRGRFDSCGKQDAWGLDLPASEGHGARAMVTYPRVEGVGPFALVTVRLDPPHGPSRWSGWPARLEDSSRRLAAMVQAIDASRVVLLGDFGAPATFRLLAGRLQGAGLTEQALPPSWPLRLGPVPTLPVHRFDRLWAGDEWAFGGAEALPGYGQPRTPIASTLLPEVMQAR